MARQSVTMRAVAEKHERLAKTAENSAEPEGFGDCAKLQRKGGRQFAVVEKSERIGESAER